MIRNDNEVGHPITNMLMGQASAGDMSTADHTDQGGVVELDQVNFSAPGVTGPVTLERAEAGAGPVTDQVDEHLAEQFLEIENLVEGARDAIVQRLEQFDAMDARVGILVGELACINNKLDAILSHFGLMKRGG